MFISVDVFNFKCLVGVTKFYSVYKVTQAVPRKLLGIFEELKPVGQFHMDDLNNKLCWGYVARIG